MPEPINLAVEAAKSYGINAVLMLAGFAGSVVSLSYLRTLSRSQMLMAVLSGALSANYLTPLFMWLVKIPIEFQLGMGFLLGLTSMRLTPLLVDMMERFVKKSEAS